MRTLYLHIGHGKTGSSFLQSCFALGRGDLARRGVVYLRHASLRQAAAGEITGGNGRAMIRALQRPILAPLFAARLRLVKGDVLLSSENLLFPIANRAGDGRLARFARRAGFDRVEALLFIRDPFDHLPSVFMQQVKRGGFTGGIDATAAAYRYPALVRKAILSIEANEGASLLIRNYSRRRSGIKAVAEAWLGLDEDALPAPPRASVNRSLTAAELAVMAELNETFGAAASLVADRLCNGAPEHEAAKVGPSLDAARRMANRLRGDVEWVNERLADADRYEMKAWAAVVRDEAAPPPLTPEQSEIVRAAVAELERKRGS